MKLHAAVTALAASLLVACSGPDEGLSRVRATLDLRAGLCARLRRVQVQTARLDTANAECLRGLSVAREEHRVRCERFFAPAACRREQEEIIAHAAAR